MAFLLLRNILPCLVGKLDVVSVSIFACNPRGVCPSEGSNSSQIQHSKFQIEGTDYKRKYTKENIQYGGINNVGLENK